jgi:hypothetical protein
MRIEVVSGDSKRADAFIEECLVHLARCGVAAERVPAAAWIDLPDRTGPLLRVVLGGDPDSDSITDVPSLLRRMAELGVIAVSAMDDEQLLMKRLGELGYL